MFGSGQLGRMFAIEARKMGYRVHTFSPDSDTPTGQVADVETSADYGDIDAVRSFAGSVSVVTFEFENVPVTAIEAATELVDCFPGREVLYTTQDRLREKTFLAGRGFPVTAFRPVRVIDDLYRGVEELGVPAVLKTAGFGYDGKGQVRLSALGEIPAAFDTLAGAEGILERFVDFEREVSVVCARDRAGNFADYGVIENTHRNHILDTSHAPAAISRGVAKEAVDISRSIAESLDYVGTLCVEFFVTRDEKLLVNELAPRPHNSGHLTFDACATSQFEQQLRAVCGLPLGSTGYFRPAAMANLLGELWAGGEPDWYGALTSAGVKCHVYGKTEPRPGRKMGHLTALDDTARAALRAVIKARERLGTVSAVPFARPTASR